MVYLITYQLNRPGKNYQSLYSALQQYDYIKDNFLHTVWFVSTSWTASQIYNHLASHMDRTDRLFITPITRGTHGWMSPHIWNWITARV